MNEKIRFNLDCNNYSDALEYTKNRYIQLLKFGARSFKTYNYDDIALIAIFKWSDGSEYYGIYLYKDFRNKGLYEDIWNTLGKPTIVTLEECNLTDYLVKKKIDYISYSHKKHYRGVYQIIENYYGNKTTERSQIHLMNHIDEGLAILESLYATQEAKEAYILHPMLQSNDSLLENIYNPKLLYYVNARTLILAMEYRKTANNFLPIDLKEMSCNNPVLSVLHDVNMMLIADKIQNCKDFNIYHNGTHKDTESLIKYFRMWLKVLENTLRTHNIKHQIDIAYSDLVELIKLKHTEIFCV